uniref:Uncharacterized protein n=1 Tax=Romanomermis culicivorax TaxID=13658 RepID=A0A915IAA6_ROMCU
MNLWKELLDVEAGASQNPAINPDADQLADHSDDEKLDDAQKDYTTQQQKNDCSKSIDNLNSLD